MPQDPAGADTRSLVVETGDRVALRTRVLRVKVVAGPDAGRELTCPGPEAKVGSSRKCDLVLTDPTVSRHHVTLRLDGVRIRVKDAGSHNGTTVDGLAVHDVEAKPDS